MPHSADLLLTKVQSLNDSTVTLDIYLLQVLQQLTALTDHLQHRTLSAEVVTVVLEVLCRWLIRYENNAIWLSGEPVSVLDLPY